MVTATNIEERLTAMETQLAEPKHLLEERLPEATTTPKKRGLPAIIGTFADDPAYDEAMRLGREWRESQRIEDEENA